MPLFTVLLALSLNVSPARTPEELSRLVRLLDVLDAGADPGTRTALRLLGVGGGALVVAPNVRELAAPNAPDRLQAGALVGVGALLLGTSLAAFVLPTPTGWSETFRRRLAEPNADLERILRETDERLVAMARLLRALRWINVVGGALVAGIGVGLTVWHEISPAADPTTRAELRAIFPTIGLAGATLAVLGSVETTQERAIRAWREEAKVGVGVLPGGAVVSLRGAF